MGGLQSLRVSQPGITCQLTPVISRRQRHRAEATEVPWEHTTRTSGATSVAVGLPGGQSREAGGWLGERALGERLRLGEVPWTTAIHIFCAQPENIFYMLCHLYGYSVLSKLFAKQVKWREKRKKAPCF